MNVKNVADNKTFLKSVKTFFSDNLSSFEKIYVIEKDRVITDDREIAEIYNQYFSNRVPDLGIKVTDALTLHSPKVNGSILKAISKYQHTKIVKENVYLFSPFVLTL